MVNGEGAHSPVKGISQAAIGRALGLAPSTITKLRGQGMPVTSVAEAQAWRELRQNSLQRKPEPKLLAAPPAPLAPAPRMLPPLPDEDDETFGFGETLDQARLRDKISEANQNEMREAEMRGKFLVKADFDRYLFNAGRMLRDTLANCSRRIGAEVSGLADAAACEAVIDREHRAALASFAQLIRHTVKIELESNPLAAPIEPEA